MQTIDFKVNMNKKMLLTKNNKEFLDNEKQLVYFNLFFAYSQAENND
jgi:hypothetical protein